MFGKTTANAWINDYALPWGFNILLALAIFVLGRWVARGIVALIRRLLVRAELDTILQNFIPRSCMGCCCSSW